ncbi:hypothetical protein P7K49_000131, partial [Saguinus oedipus]
SLNLRPPTGSQAGDTTVRNQGAAETHCAGKPRPHSDLPRRSKSPKLQTSARCTRAPEALVDGGPPRPRPLRGRSPRPPGPSPAPCPFAPDVGGSRPRPLTRYCRRPLGQAPPSARLLPGFLWSRAPLLTRLFQASSGIDSAPHRPLQAPPPVRLLRESCAPSPAPCPAAPGVRGSRPRLPHRCSRRSLAQAPPPARLLS